MAFGWAGLGAVKLTRHTDTSGVALLEGDAGKSTNTQTADIQTIATSLKRCTLLVHLFGTGGHTEVGTTLRQRATGTFARTVRLCSITGDKAVFVFGIADRRTLHQATIVVIDTLVTDLDFGTGSFGLVVSVGLAFEVFAGLSLTQTTLLNVTGATVFDSDDTGESRFFANVRLHHAGFAVGAFRVGFAGLMTDSKELRDTETLQAHFAITLSFGRVDVLLALLTHLLQGHGSHTFVVTTDKLLVGVVGFADAALSTCTTLVFFGRDHTDFVLEGVRVTDLAFGTISVSFAGLDAAVIIGRHGQTEHPGFAVTLLIATRRSTTIAFVPAVFWTSLANTTIAEFGRIGEVTTTDDAIQRIALGTGFRDFVTDLQATRTGDAGFAGIGTFVGLGAVLKALVVAVIDRHTDQTIVGTGAFGDNRAATTGITHTRRGSAFFGGLFTNGGFFSNRLLGAGVGRCFFLRLRCIAGCKKQQQRCKRSEQGVFHQAGRHRHWHAPSKKILQNLFVYTTF